MMNLVMSGVFLLVSIGIVAVVTLLLAGLFRIAPRSRQFLQNRAWARRGLMAVAMIGFFLAAYIAQTLFAEFEFSWKIGILACGGFDCLVIGGDGTANLDYHNDYLDEYHYRMQPLPLEKPCLSDIPEVCDYVARYLPGQVGHLLLIVLGAIPAAVSVWLIRFFIWRPARKITDVEAPTA